MGVPKKRGKKKKLSPAEKAQETADAALKLAQEARDEFKRNAATFDTVMREMSKTYANNDRHLCDYIDDLQDRLYGVADLLIRISEETEGGKPVTVVTREELIDAANKHRRFRIESFKKRQELKEKRDEAQKKAAELKAKPLDEMTEQELIEATEEVAGDAEANYPGNAQMFGGS